MTDVRLDKPITTLATRVVRGDGVVAIEGTAVCWTMDVGELRAGDSATAARRPPRPGRQP